MNGTGIGTSLILIATGAILAIAVDYQLSGLDVKAIGIILMVIGIIGLLISLLFLSQVNWFRRDTAGRLDETHGSTTHVTHERETVREVDPPASETTTTRTTRH